MISDRNEKVCAWLTVFGESNLINFDERDPNILFYLTNAWAENELWALERHMCSYVSQNLLQDRSLIDKSRSLYPCIHNSRNISRITGWKVVGCIVQHHHKKYSLGRCMKWVAKNPWKKEVDSRRAVEVYSLLRFEFKANRIETVSVRWMPVNVTIHNWRQLSKLRRICSWRYICNYPRRFTVYAELIQFGGTRLSKIGSGSGSWHELTHKK